MFLLVLIVLIVLAALIIGIRAVIVVKNVEKNLDWDDDE